jgi:hypothetical protein
LLMVIANAFVNGPGTAGMRRIVEHGVEEFGAHFSSWRDFP